MATCDWPPTHDAQLGRSCGEAPRNEAGKLTQPDRDRTSRQPSLPRLPQRLETEDREHLKPHKGSAEARQPSVPRLPHIGDNTEASDLRRYKPNQRNSSRGESRPSSRGKQKPKEGHPLRPPSPAPTSPTKASSKSLPNSNSNSNSEPQHGLGLGHGGGVEAGNGPSSSSFSSSVAAPPPPPAKTVATQQFQTPIHPSGKTFRFLFTSTWSDPHYIGLDALEFLDTSGIPIRPANVASNHGSIRNVPGMQLDNRTEQTFLLGAPSCSEQMWLCPLQASPHILDLQFEAPTAVAGLRVWNYSRTPSRGVRDVEIWADGELIYKGIFKQGQPAPLALSRPGSRCSTAGGAAPPPPCAGSSNWESILFTSNPEILAAEGARIYLPEPQDIAPFMQEEDDDVPDRPTERPGTALR